MPEETVDRPAASMPRLRASGRVALVAALLGLGGCRAPLPPPQASASPGTHGLPTRFIITAPQRDTGTQCFPVESLSPADRALAERLLRDASDGEALYTIADGLKPISSGRAFRWRSGPVPDSAALDSAAAIGRAAAALHCGDVAAFVHVFAAADVTADGDTMRIAEVVFADRRRVRETIRRYPVFARIGVDTTQPPPMVVERVDRAPRADRWRAYGHLFGYPDDAVDFFVAAGEEGDRTGRIVARDFRRLPTVTRFAARRGEEPSLTTFVYAVPRGAAESEEERALRRAVEATYARYVAQRGAVDSLAVDIVALWRGWFR